MITLLPVSGEARGPRGDDVSARCCTDEKRTGSNWPRWEDARQKENGKQLAPVGRRLTKREREAIGPGGKTPDEKRTGSNWPRWEDARRNKLLSQKPKKKEEIGVRTNKLLLQSGKRRKEENEEEKETKETKEKKKKKQRRRRRKKKMTNHLAGGPPAKLSNCFG